MLIGTTIALPAETQTDPHTLAKRGPTDTYGDWTGSTSQYPDGSGTYVTSGDVFHYHGSNPQKCWTDLVSDSARAQLHFHRRVRVPC